MKCGVVFEQPAKPTPAIARAESWAPPRVLLLAVTMASIALVRVTIVVELSNANPQKVVLTVQDVVSTVGLFISVSGGIWLQDFINHG